MRWTWWNWTRRWAWWNWIGDQRLDKDANQYRVNRLERSTMSTFKKTWPFRLQIFQEKRLDKDATQYRVNIDCDLNLLFPSKSDYEFNRSIMYWKSPFSWIIIYIFVVTLYIIIFQLRSLLLVVSKREGEGKRNIQLRSLSLRKWYLVVSN